MVKSLGATAAASAATRSLAVSSSPRQQRQPPGPVPRLVPVGRIGARRCQPGDRREPLRTPAPSGGSRRPPPARPSVPTEAGQVPLSSNGDEDRGGAVVTDTATPARYRFGDSARSGVLLGLSVRQAVPLVAGVRWLTLWLMAQQPLIGMAGLAAGGVVAFGRWRRAPLYEVAVPGVRLVVASASATRPVGASLAARRRSRLRRRSPGGVGRSRAASKSSSTGQPGPIVGGGRARPVGPGSVSMVVPVHGAGFPVASLREQDGLLAGWGAALAPLARARCPVVTGHVAGVGPPDRRRRAPRVPRRPRRPAPLDRPERDYDELLDVQAPFTIAHEVLVTVTVDLRRVRAADAAHHWRAAIDALGDEARLLVARGWRRPGCRSIGRCRRSSCRRRSGCVATRPGPASSTVLSRSLAAAVGRGPSEWGRWRSRRTGSMPGSTASCIARTGWRRGRCCRWRRLAGPAAHRRRRRPAPSRW